LNNVNLFLGVIFETLKAYPDQRGFSNNWLIGKVILCYKSGQNPTRNKDVRTEKQTLTIEQKALKWETFKVLSCIISRYLRKCLIFTWYPIIHIP